MTDVAYNTSLTEYQIAEPRIEGSIGEGCTRFTLYVHMDEAPVKGQFMRWLTRTAGELRLE